MLTSANPLETRPRPERIRVDDGTGDRHAGTGALGRASQTLAVPGGLVVVVCHHEELFRAGLVQHLRSHPDLAIVAHTGRHEAAVDLCRRHSPRVFLCDVECGLSVEDVVNRVRAASPESRTLPIGRDGVDSARLLRCGAWGVISANSPGDHFARAIRVVAAGQYWVDRRTLNVLARQALCPRAEVKREKPLLSSREVEILQLISAGNTNLRIAELLYIEVNTVRTHLRRIYQKLEVHDRTSAVMRASERGLIRIGERGSR